MVNYKEEERDLFTVGDKYILAHCISKDAKMGAGIAVRFKEDYKLQALQRVTLEVGEAYLYHNVFSLVTKVNYWDKPTYETLEQSLHSMKEQALAHNFTHIAMPRIGSGLDRLTWSKNREIIKEVFKDTGINILVCYI